MLNSPTPQIHIENSDDLYVNLATVTSARAGEHLHIPRCASPESAIFDTASILSTNTKASTRGDENFNTSNPFASTRPDSRKSILKSSKGDWSLSPEQDSSMVYSTPKPLTPKPNKALKPITEYDSEKDLDFDSPTTLVAPPRVAFIDQKHGHSEVKEIDLEHNYYERPEASKQVDSRGKPSAKAKTSIWWQKNKPTKEQWPSVLTFVVICLIMLGVLGFIIYAIVPTPQPT